jgi:hypothetical protein
LIDEANSSADIFENKDLKLKSTLNLASEGKHNFGKNYKIHVNELKNSLVGICIDDNFLKIFNEEKVYRNYQSR